LAKLAQNRAKLQLIFFIC